VTTDPVVSPTPEASTAPASANAPLSIQLSASASPAAYDGPNCPGGATFQATVTVSRSPTTISYRWVYTVVGGDGTTGPSGTYTFSGSGAQQHHFPATLTGLAEPTMKVDATFELLSPETRHVTAEYQQTCGAKAADPVPDTSGCPQFAHVTTYITTSVGPMTVTYHWVYSDGSTSTEQTQPFPIAGSQHAKVTSPSKIMQGSFGAKLVIDTPAPYTTALVHATC
jgi:hypothetical protein